ncbi:hypothetical protein [Nocardioides flavescens]|uniref:Uncharacterized protein n=1 Tax=Nocardioides flavescens TaxID=2691959 RepID=A0A6L7F028_9ACTN|nr:hypothetical protein [Nocardioides flavescens]MXG88034.1 hypothetical protein [Nocardioides flavescens]
MSTGERAADAAAEDDGARRGRPAWRDREHPTFAALTGFYAGLLYVALVPGGFIALMTVLFGADRAEELVPFVLVTLVVPIALVVNQRTRRFGKYFWLGMVLSAVVVIGVAAAVLWFMVERQS